MPAIAVPQVNIKSPSLGGRSVTASRAGFLHNYFYFFMSLLIGVLVVYGFSRTVDKNLIHPAVRRPFSSTFMRWCLAGGWCFTCCRRRWFERAMWVCIGGSGGLVLLLAS